LSTTLPTKANSTFQWWATNSSATSATRASWGSYTANSATTLYAVWTCDFWYTLSGSNCVYSGPTSSNGESIPCGAKYRSKISWVKTWWPKWTVNPSWSSSSRSSPNYWRNFNITNYPAFVACADLWTWRRLPTQTELNWAATWSAWTGWAYACKSTLGLQESSGYWSSTEYNNSNGEARLVLMYNNGSVSLYEKHTTSLYVVCLHD
jgi:hypothetical protein